VVPYRDVVPRGLFATRAPSRPNPIGLSCLRLLSVDSGTGILILESGDLLDGTPVLDLKPYLPGVDAFPDARSGWFGASRSPREQADGRFEEPGSGPGG
jgi:tRNA (Thr-GGU) A37 N-methylase